MPKGTIFVEIQTAPEFARYIRALIIPASLISFVLNLTANYHIVVA